MTLWFTNCVKFNFWKGYLPSESTYKHCNCNFWQLCLPVTAVRMVWKTVIRPIAWNRFELLSMKWTMFSMYTCKKLQESLKLNRGILHFIFTLLTSYFQYGTRENVATQNNIWSLSISQKLFQSFGDASEVWNKRGWEYTQEIFTNCKDLFSRSILLARKISENLINHESHIYPQLKQL